MKTLTFWGYVLEMPPQNGPQSQIFDIDNMVMTTLNFQLNS